MHVLSFFGLCTELTRSEWHDPKKSGDVTSIFFFFWADQKHFAQIHSNKRSIFVFCEVTLLQYRKVLGVIEAGGSLVYVDIDQGSKETSGTRPSPHVYRSPSPYPIPMVHTRLIIVYLFFLSSLEMSSIGMDGSGEFTRKHPSQLTLILVPLPTCGHVEGSFHSRNVWFFWQTIPTHSIHLSFSRFTASKLLLSYTGARLNENTSEGLDTNNLWK